MRDAATAISEQRQKGAKAGMSASGFRRVGWFSTVLGVGLLGFVGLWAVAQQTETVQPVGTEPRLEASEAPAALDIPATTKLMTLEEFMQQQELILEHYAILDAEHGVIRIPIERAMELVAQRGLPDWSDD